MPVVVIVLIRHRRNDTTAILLSIQPARAPRRRAGIISRSEMTTLFPVGAFRCKSVRCQGLTPRSYELWPRWGREKCRHCLVRGVYWDEVPLGSRHVLTSRSFVTLRRVPRGVRVV